MQKAPAPQSHIACWLFRTTPRHDHAFGQESAGSGCAPGQEGGVQHFAEVRARDDLWGGRHAGKAQQCRAQQAHAVGGQRSLAKLVDDTQRPVAMRQKMVL